MQFGQFEFEGCCWEIEPNPFDSGNEALHLVPNFVVVTFNLAPGETIEEVGLTMVDLEGGIVGDSPISAFIVRGAGGDFVIFHNTEIGELEFFFATPDMLSQGSSKSISTAAAPRVTVSVRSGNPLSRRSYKPSAATRVPTRDTCSPTCTTRVVRRPSW